jgi:outer membrane protein assembly factor BamB
VKSKRQALIHRAIHLAATTIPICIIVGSGVVVGAPPVPTRSYDNFRSGANVQEKQLTPGNVTGVHLLRQIALDPDDDPRIEAQPLYMPQLEVNGAIHKVLIVCTMDNNVYAFDVENGAQLWKRNLGKPVTPISQGPAGGEPGLTKTDIDLYGINLNWGVLSTPAIDVDTNILYAVSWSSTDGKRDDAMYQLNAVDLKSGTVKGHLPITGNAGQMPSFSSPDQKQRPALLLSPLHQNGGGHIKKTLFVAFGVTQEKPPKAAVHGFEAATMNASAPLTHGWVIAFDVDSFKQTAAWSTTPKTFDGGIWQAGQGPASDDQGNVFVITSNGGRTAADTTDLTESFVRLEYTGTSLHPVDWFTPFLDSNRPGSGPNGYDFTDQDLGSAGPILISVSGSNLLAGAGKDGVLYIFDRNNLGKKVVDPSKPSLADNAPLLNAIFFTYFPGNQFNPLVSINSFPGSGQTHHLHGSPVAWASDTRGMMLFCWGENSPLRAWTIDKAGQMKFLGESHETASAFSDQYNAMPGGMITLSANGGKDGIVWASVPVKGTWPIPGVNVKRPATAQQTQGNANQQVVEGVLRAYDASTFQGTAAQGNPEMKLLWQNTNPGNPKLTDTRFTFSKFNVPVVADGKIFLATYDGRLLIFGL